MPADGYLPPPVAHPRSSDRSRDSRRRVRLPALVPDGQPRGTISPRRHASCRSVGYRARFLSRMGGASGSGRMVTAKWRRNRESYIRVHVLPVLETVRLDELIPRHIVDLQARLQGNGLAPSTVDPEPGWNRLDLTRPSIHRTDRETPHVSEGSCKSGRPGSNRRRPAWEADRRSAGRLWSVGVIRAGPRT